MNRIVDNNVLIEQITQELEEMISTYQAVLDDSEKLESIRYAQGAKMVSRKILSLIRGDEEE